MIIVKLTGGLGNQMFQYAMGRMLSIKHGTQLVLDKSGYKTYKVHNYELDRFQIVENYQSHFAIAADKVLTTLRIKTPVPTFKEPFFHYSDSALKVKPPVAIDGYWQSEKYFADIRKNLLEEFNLKNSPSQENQEWIKAITKSPSVSLHIRRGDYISNPHANAFHGILPLTYYANAVEKLKEYEKNLTYFIFSDDPEWVSKNLKLDGETYYISNNQKQGYEDLRLMKHCKHNVIANSSFSWWAAWLNEAPDKRVCGPNRWFKDPTVNTSDVLPTDWLKIGIE